MAKKIVRGIFITFEGGEGSGKSTHSKRLFKDLKAGGCDVIHTIEPGATPLGSKVRDILLEKDNIRLGQKAELFLFEADRAQHVEEIIKPALEEGKIVLCDRFNAATFAYQGYGLGMDIDTIEKIDAFARGGIKADLTILLDLDVETGLRRARNNKKADRMEKREKSFHEKVRAGYLALAKKNPRGFEVIEVKEDIEGIYSLVKKKVYGFIKRHKGTA